MALFYECLLKCARKGLDTADIVREAMLRQQSSGTADTFMNGGGFWTVGKAGGAFTGQSLLIDAAR